jgi:DNA polymerase-4
MDAFFAGIEQRDCPELKGRPVIIASDLPRSVVATASYEARKFGIGSAMPVFMAKRKCRNLIIVRPDKNKYRAESKKIMKILQRFSPLVEQVSIDEAFMDIHGSERLFGPPEKIAASIKKAIFEDLSLTCSIGAAPVKFLAKIASDIKKPDGITIITREQMTEFIESLPIQKVPGIGKKAVEKMQVMQIHKLGDVKYHDPDILAGSLGKSLGRRLVQLSHGIDNSKVKTSSDRKSISSEKTLSKDILDNGIIKKILLDRAEHVGATLRKNNLVCNNVFIKLKFSDFTQITRTRKLPYHVCSSSAIFHEAVALYNKIQMKKKIRLAGVGVSGLKDKNSPVQMQLFPDPGIGNDHWEPVDRAVDCIAEKFGPGIIKKANLDNLNI